MTENDKYWKGYEIYLLERTTEFFKLVRKGEVLFDGKSPSSEVYLMFVGLGHENLKLNFKGGIMALEEVDLEEMHDITSAPGKEAETVESGPENKGSREPEQETLDEYYARLYGYE